MAISQPEIRRRLRQLGERLAAQRLSRNLAQIDLAAEAGISLATLRRLEAGDNTSLDTLVRLMAALSLADRLDALLPPADVRPIDRVRPSGKTRQRATRRASGQPGPTRPWVWGDQT